MGEEVKWSKGAWRERGPGRGGKVGEGVMGEKVKLEKGSWEG